MLNLQRNSELLNSARLRERNARICVSHASVLRTGFDEVQFSDYPRPAGIVLANLDDVVLQGKGFESGERLKA
ncbi:hypothetical protein PVT68_00790 [Microbulbifer bruguierae]|uniref:Uncharacterized protein n=1 Tax=Microbulbifer bruguierae TaxID=3029061 RepID=A0ABY8NEI1_9GAMM|nr:hypothetical protein [Microbulbifer bruguierae]WGL16850.1 hypothetical protein PVT68_00790 [Microbulbifer bruguierae]